MESSQSESTLSFSNYPIKKKIDILKDKDSINCSINLITNLFNVALLPNKTKNVFIFGIDLQEPYRNDEPKIPLMRKCQRLKVFNEHLKKYFDWHKLTGLSLFGKIKQEHLDTLNKFDFSIYIPSSQGNSPSIYEIDQIPENIDASDFIIQLRFKKGKNINDLKISDDKKEYNQIFHTFFNSIINKLLTQLGFKKECTTRKVLYYREKDMAELKYVKVIGSNCPLYSFSALKAVCDSYEGGNIYLKLLPKNILKSDERYSDSYQYYQNINEYNAFSVFKDKVLNQKGITTYNSTIIKIEDIELQNPFQLFFDQKGKSKSVGEYLIEKYHLDIRNESQLMAVRYVDFNKKIPKDQAKKLYFPMQYLGVMGNPFNLTINIKDLIEKPHEKLQRISKIRAELIQLKKNPQVNEEGIEAAFDSSFNPVKVNGIILKQPIIIFGKEIRVIPNEFGRFELSNIQPFDLFEIKNIQVFLIGLSDIDGQIIYNKLQDASKELGIKLTTQPKVRNFIGVISDEEYEQTFTNVFKELAQEEKIKKENKANKQDKLQLIFAFLSSKYKKTKIYTIFKNTINKSELEVPSQVIVLDNKKTKGDLSPFSNIFTQIWAKLGQKLFSCDLSFAKNTLVMAYAVSQYGSNKSITSLCFSLNEYKAQYCFSTEFSERNDNRLSTVLRLMISNAIKILWKNTKRKVDNIVIYREGLNERQIKGVRETELSDIMKGLQDGMSSIAKYVDKEEKYTKQRGYWKDMPKVCLVLVNKFNEIKMFMDHKQEMMGKLDKMDNTFNRNYQDISNVPIGTVVDTIITHEVYYDFYLNSAYSHQGTNSPTHYVVVYDDTDLTAIAITRMTFILTYLCYNTVQSIKIPSPLYFVIRRNQFIKDHLDSNIPKKLQTINVSL